MTIEIEKIKACLLGGAIGDSFGAPVEIGRASCRERV